MYVEKVVFTMQAIAGHRGEQAISGRLSHKELSRK